MKQYKVRFSKRAVKELTKMDNKTQKIIRTWIRNNLVDTENPRQFGKPLDGNLSDKWSYRVGTYRILAEIHDDEVVIFVFSVGHRREVYKRH